MNRYEGLYILQHGLDEAVIKGLIDRFSAVITNVGGTIESVNKWGTKKFAYPIHYKSDGYYVLVTFTAPPSLPAELERQMRITDEVVRYMFISKPILPVRPVRERRPRRDASETVISDSRPRAAAESAPAVESAPVALVATESIAPVVIEKSAPVAPAPVVESEAPAVDTSAKEESVASESEDNK